MSLVYLAVFGARGDLIEGGTLDASGIQAGLSRVIFPFFAGVLLMRAGKTIRVGNPFLVCSLLLAAALSIPRIGGTAHMWLNGLYEATCIIILFPLIVAMGGGEKREDRRLYSCRALLR